MLIDAGMKFIDTLIIFDACVTVRRRYNNVNSQIDATLVILLIISISST